MQDGAFFFWILSILTYYKHYHAHVHGPLFVFLVTYFSYGLSFVAALVPSVL